MLNSFQKLSKANKSVFGNLIKSNQVLQQNIKIINENLKSQSLNYKISEAEIKFNENHKFSDSSFKHFLIKQNYLSK